MPLRPLYSDLRLDWSSARSVEGWLGRQPAKSITLQHQQYLNQPVHLCSVQLPAQCLVTELVPLRSQQPLH